jgi:hypothetical protein
MDNSGIYKNCNNTSLPIWLLLHLHHKLDVNDVLSRTSYMKVVEKHSETIVVENEEGLKWSIGRTIVEGECKSADHYTREEKVSRTRLAEVMTHEVRNAAITVQFELQPDPKRVEEKKESCLNWPKKSHEVKSDVCVVTSSW